MATFFIRKKMKYLNKYNNISSYNSAKQGEFELPHVSLINDTKEIKYDPVQSPGPANNEIWYTGEYYDLEDAIEKFSILEVSYAGPGIVSNELVGNKYIVTFNGSVTKLGLDDTETTFFPIFISDVDLQVQCNITSITIPNSVTSIGNSTFYECYELTSITIPDSVTSIGEGAFFGCTGLTSVTIPNSVTSIGESAFHGCSSLTSITIPNSVTSIGYYAFYGCSGLTSPVYNAHIFAYMPTSYSGAYTIPDGIESIAGSAFENCSSLTSMTLSDSITSIENWAFHHCNGLTSVTISNSVTSIGEGAFEYCNSLTSITIPNSVISIRDMAFSYCSSLTSITCSAVTPPELGDNIFYDTNDCPIYVPSQLVDTYKSTSSWSEYASRIQAIP